MSLQLDKSLLKNPYAVGVGVIMLYFIYRCIRVHSKNKSIQVGLDIATEQGYVGQPKK